MIGPSEPKLAKPPLSLFDSCWLLFLVSVLLAAAATAQDGGDQQEADPCKSNPCFNGICIGHAGNG